MGADLNAILDACIKDKLGKFFKVLTSFAVWLLRILRGLKDAEEGLDHVVPMCTLYDRLIFVFNLPDLILLFGVARSQ